MSRRALWYALLLGLALVTAGWVVPGLWEVESKPTGPSNLMTGFIPDFGCSECTAAGLAGAALLLVGGYLVIRSAVALLIGYHRD